MSDKFFPRADLLSQKRKSLGVLPLGLLIALRKTPPALPFILGSPPAPPTMKGKVSP